MIVAARLHEVVEDSHTSLDHLEGHFGPQVAGLVDQLTKLGWPTTSERLKTTIGGTAAIKINLADSLPQMRSALWPRKTKGQSRGDDGLLPAAGTACGAAQNRPGA